jgi:hypothetical protein
VALKYKIKTRKIMDGDDEVGTVHGLSLNNIVGLINNNRPAVESLFNRFQDKTESAMTDEEVASIGVDMIEQAPLMVAQIIALATDAYEGYEAVEGEPTPLDAIMSMPVGLQMAFLQEIGDMTFSAGGGAKKMLALALKAVRGGSQSVG